MHGRPFGTSRPYEIEARRRALAGAEIVIAEGVSQLDAAKRAKCKAQMVQEMYLILKLGTEEEIAQTRTLQVGVRKFVEAIRARTSKQDILAIRATPSPKVYSEKSIEKRKQAFAGAKIARDEGISHVDAAKRVGVARHAVSDAFVIMTHGTAEEIIGGESGLVPLSDLIEQVHARVPQDVRKGRRKKATYSHEVRGLRDTEVIIWEALRTALGALTSLPSPADVKNIVTKHQKRADKVNEMIIPAFSWLTEFSDAWTK